MLQGKFDYVKVTYSGKVHEGYLVDVTDGVGTLAEMNTTTAFQMREATIEVLAKGAKSFLPKKETPMSPTEVYRLKLRIDADLKPYGASAIGWPTHWCVLRLVKYDCPWEALRSTVYSNFVKDEADWIEHKGEIIAELQTICPHIQQK